MMSFEDDVEMLLDGEMLCIAAVLDELGNCPANEFFDEDRKRRGKVAPTFLKLADHGECKNRTKFKVVEGQSGLFEVKSGQIRLFCFRHENYWLMLNGIIKKQDKLKSSDIKRAVNLRDAFCRRHAI